ncbi:MAG: N,N-dimethylformamidase beta subunit family domain-containing protein [Roseovarius sp.]
MKKVLGYCDDWSAVAGGTVQFKVSTYGPAQYQAQLVRVICGDKDPSHGIFREDEIDAPLNGMHEGITQPIDAGSYGVVPHAPSLKELGSFTLQAWIWPTTPLKGEQGIITCWGEDDTGFSLMLDDTGALALRVGGEEVTTVSTDMALAERRWYLVSASYDALTGQIELRQLPGGIKLEKLQSAHVTGRAASMSVPAQDLIMAAFAAPLPNGKPGSVRHFNGKIDRPRLSKRALSDADIRRAAGDDPCARVEGVLAAWDFSQGIGTDDIRDTGPGGMHGKTVNLPSRGCKGHHWTGQEQNWQHAPLEYAAIHFHDDDLYDAKWDTSFNFDIPKDLKSGVYAVRLRAEDDESYITFFVRPAPGAPKAKLAFLASTVNYMAYSNYHWLFHQRFAEVTESFFTTMEKADVFLQEHNEFGLSTYDTHSDRSGVRFASRLRPILNAAPGTPCWSFNADTHILGWLDDQSIEYDVITDEDLHRDGVEALSPYTAILTGTHPEYYTTPMMDGLHSYIAGAGRLIYLGGNGFIWRCGMSDAFPGVIELRRAEDGIRYRDEEPGEYYMELTGEYGGLWRRLGLPPQALVGVGTVACGFDASGYYKRTSDADNPRAAFIFEGIGTDEKIGDFGYLGDGAAGSEIDSTNDLMGTPAHALVVAASEGHSANTLICPDEIGFHYPAMDGVQNPLVRADITFFETPGGGAVFSVGSIAWAASLPHNGYDNNVATLTGNVIRRFLSGTDFEMPT